jgi:spoIIIJ-associated protein
MDRIESEGRSVEDAIEKGLAALGVKRGEVDVQVLDEGGGGLKRWFGAGRPARVALTRTGGGEDRIRARVNELLKAMDLACQVSVTREGDSHRVDIETAGADGLLIGRKGDTLTALQHIIDRIVNHGQEERLKVTVDVGGYRERRLESLRSRALQLSSQVKQTGRERSTDPLPPPDRRIIHLALAGDTGIRTYTVGEGTYRAVVIAPADSRGRDGGRDRRNGSRGGRRSEPSPAAVGAPIDDGDEDE